MVSYVKVQQDFPYLPKENITKKEGARRNMKTITTYELILVIEQLKMTAEVSQFGTFKQGFIGALDIIKNYAKTAESRSTEN